MPHQAVAGAIRRLAREFRALRGWRVTYGLDGEYRGQCIHGDGETRIVPFGQPQVPADYPLHEVLHAAFAKFRTIRGGRARRAFEEALVQDICAEHVRRIQAP